MGYIGHDNHLMPPLDRNLKQSRSNLNILYGQEPGSLTPNRLHTGESEENSGIFRRKANKFKLDLKGKAQELKFSELKVTSLEDKIIK